MKFLCVHLLDTRALISDGVSVHIRSLEEGMKRIGHSMDIVSFSDVSEEQKILYREKVARAYRKGGSNSGIKEMFNLRRDLISDILLRLDISSYDGIFAQGPLEFTSIPKRKIPVILTIHAFRSDDELRKGRLIEGTSEFMWFREEEAKALKTADRIISPTRPIIDEAVRRGANSSVLKVVPNGIDCNRYESTRTNIDAEKKNIIGVLGRLSRQKGQDVLIRAFAILQKKNTDIELDIGGPGELLDEYKTLANELGVADRVNFCGEIKNVPDFLSRLTLAVLPSRWEGGNPFVLLECGAMKLPVVASNVGGIAEMIEEGKDGWLVEPDDPEALAEAIFVALTDKAEAVRRATKLREKIFRDYSLEQMAKGYVEAIKANILFRNLTV